MIGASAYGQGGALAAAVNWLADLLTGSLGTAIAVLGIAAVGFALLQGRLPVGRAAVVILGCFVLFGAHAIASGLMDLAGSTRGAAPLPAAAVVAPAPKAPAPPPYDPYAGASVQRAQ